MQQIMEESAGIYRPAPALEQAADKLRRLQERVQTSSWPITVIRSTPS